MPVHSQRAHETKSTFGKRRNCTHLQNPFADCYCMNISGAKIPRMLDYCVGDYASCPIFRNRASSVCPSAGAGAATE